MIAAAEKTETKGKPTLFQANLDPGSELLVGAQTKFFGKRGSARLQKPMVARDA